MDIFSRMQSELEKVATEKDILNSSINVECRALTSEEAIGNTEHEDYPIHKGKEVMIEADFCGAKGQAFTDQFGAGRYSVSDLTEMEFSCNRDRACFIAGINAVWKYLGRAGKTVHCRDKEPVECAAELEKEYDFSKKTLLVGLQPRFLEVLAKNGQVRVLDLDKDNIGEIKAGVEIEDGAKFAEAVEWCEQIFATGSTLCNDSIEMILDAGKPVTFFGITIAAAADILGLNTFCAYGS